MGDATPSGGDGGDTGAGAPATTTPDTTTQGTDPTKTASSSQAFDSSKLSDEDFQKFFEDPRAFTHPRFKALNEQAKEAKTLRENAEKAENAQLEKDKKFQELSQKHETAAKEWQGKYETTLIDNKIQSEAAKLGITDFDAATKLIDRSGIAITDGNVTGVEEAVKALSESKAYLVDKSKQVPTIGSPTNPGDQQASTGTHRQFKASEISDPAFYKANAKEIDASLRAKVPIIDDRPGSV